MGPKLNRTWLIISFIIIANILVFVHLSNKLEGFVVDSMVEKQQASLGL